MAQTFEGDDYVSQKTVAISLLSLSREQPYELPLLGTSRESLVKAVVISSPCDRCEMKM